MTANNPDEEEGLAEFKSKTAMFLSSTLKLMFDLIVESGRDRFSYLKEAVLRPTSTCARPILGADSGEEFMKASIFVSSASRRSSVVKVLKNLTTRCFSGCADRNEETLLKWTEGLKSVSGVKALLEEDLGGAAFSQVDSHVSALYSLYRR